MAEHKNCIKPFTIKLKEILLFGFLYSSFFHYLYGVRADINSCDIMTLFFKLKYMNPGSRPDNQNLPPAIFKSIVCR